MYFGLFGPGGRPNLLLAQEDPRIKALAPLEHFLDIGTAIPGAAERLGSFRTYADADVSQVLGPFAATARRVAATTMDHTVFLNRGDRFEARALPVDAQLAPAFYVGIADFDGDGS